MDGIVRSFSRRHGYGFIDPLIGRPGCEAVFFHATALPFGLEGLPIGARVSFVLVRGTNGKPQAANIRLRTLSGKAILRQLGAASGRLGVKAPSVEREAGG